MTTLRELRGIKEELGQLTLETLYQLYVEKQTDFGKVSLELERRRHQRRVHVPAEEAPVEDAGPRQRMIIAPELGFDIYNFHVFTSGRDARSDRYHTHGDAVKYYVRGRGFEVIGGERFEVKVGDFIHVPANTWHGTENPYNEPLVFLAAQQLPGTLRQVPTPFIDLRGTHDSPDVRELSEEKLATLDPSSLYKLYLQEQLEFGRVSLEIQRRREGKRLHVPAEQAPLLGWGPGQHMIISPELGFDIYTFQLFLENVPARSELPGNHTWGDAVKYYIAGRGVESVGDRRFQVKTGDFLHVPGNTEHGTQNPHDEPLRFLCWRQFPGTFRQVPAPLIPR